MERLSRGIVLKRRFSRRFGSTAVFVTPGAALSYWRFELDKTDPVLLNAAERIVSPGSVVWDVGANVGLFTFCAAFLAGAKGSVIAIEPDPWLASLLNKSAAIQPAYTAPVKVIAAAISEGSGITALHITATGRARNFIDGASAVTRAPVRATQAAVKISLDWLAGYLPLPNVLKVDVEGMEAQVLRGAKNVLTSKPKILCEVYAENQQEVAAVLREHGYNFYDADNQLKPVELPAYNTLALTEGLAQSLGLL